MPLFTYTIPLPVSGNNPSVDQPNMTTNNASVNSIIGIDHYSFNVSNGGLHKQSTYPVQTIPSTSAGQAAIYSNTAGQSQLFGTTDAGANAYQLSRFIDAQFTKFGTFTAAGTVSGTYVQTAGWTFLPGGLLFQYAQVTRASISPSTINVTYPVAFTTSQVIVTITPICVSGGTSAVHLPSIVNGSVTATGFTCNWDSSTTGYAGFTWTAIGL